MGESHTVREISNKVRAEIKKDGFKLEYQLNGKEKKEIKCDMTRI